MPYPTWLFEYYDKRYVINRVDLDTRFIVPLQMYKSASKEVIFKLWVI